MNKLGRWSCALLLFAQISVVAEPPAWSGQPDFDYEIKALPGMMRFDLSELNVDPGSKIKVTFSNPDDLEHNWVLIDHDEKDPNGTQFATDCIMLGAKGAEMAWTVDSPRVLAKSGMVGPDKVSTMYFEAPEKVGDYLYLCTFPGHATLMKGKLRVGTRRSPFKKLTYKVYEGQFDAIPDFNKLTPIEEGEAKVIDPKPLIGGKDNRAILWEGTFSVVNWNKWDFFLAADEAARLSIDGEIVVETDKTKPLSIKKARELLAHGEHSLRLAYFEKEGNEELSLIATCEAFGKADLVFTKSYFSKKDASEKKIPAIYLKPENPGEAIVHRTFIGKSQPRVITVGYPGKVNVAWNADTMNLDILWRGGFVNVGKHWNGRGYYSEIGGFDSFRPVKGLSLQVLESLEEPWICYSKTPIKYERDKHPDDIKKEFHIGIPHPDYHFIGYTLDSKRFPTFEYKFQDLSVTDTFAPKADQTIETVTRKLTFTGKAKAGTHFLLATNSSFKLTEDGWYDCGSHLMKVSGIKPIQRTLAFKETADTPPAKPRNELLLPILGDQSVEAIYRWKKPVAGRTE